MAFSIRSCRWILKEINNGRLWNARWQQVHVHCLQGAQFRKQCIYLVSLLPHSVTESLPFEGNNYDIKQIHPHTSLGLNICPFKQDFSYLTLYMDEVERELKEKKEWTICQHHLQLLTNVHVSVRFSLPPLPPPVLLVESVTNKIINKQVAIKLPKCKFRELSSMLTQN